jgi:hypothetical protein
VKKETKDKAMINYGSMTLVLRSKMIFPPISFHKSVWYWNTRWFYIKNENAPDRIFGLPVFVNSPPVEKDSWSFILNLAQYPKLARWPKESRS